MDWPGSLRERGFENGETGWLAVLLLTAVGTRYGRVRAIKIRFGHVTSELPLRYPSGHATWRCFQRILRDESRTRDHKSGN